MNTAEALADIDRVVGEPPPSAGSGYIATVVDHMTRLAACIKRHSPPGSEYRSQGDRFAAMSVTQGSPRLAGGAMPDKLLRGVLSALRSDIVAGKLATFEEMVRADVYADLVSQGEALHVDGYSRAGIVLVGAALEDHVRKLAEKHSITLVTDRGEPKKANVLNADLKKAGAYGEVQRATVEGWQKLRNVAAHGEAGFDGPDRSKLVMIEPMIQGVRGFIAQYPA